MSAGRVHVIQGQFEVSRDDPSCCLTTVLGSCISVCMFDPLARAGGMNHFLLASGQAGEAASASYGVNAMELLINALLKQGARRARLRAHVFGGANMMAGLGSIGTRMPNSSPVSCGKRRSAFSAVRPVETGRGEFLALQRPGRRKLRPRARGRETGRTRTGRRRGRAVLTCAAPP